MSYTLPLSLDLGPAHTGKTVYAQLKNESWTNVGDPITTGITEIGTSGKYRTVLTIPDAHSGFVSFYFSTDDANTPCCPVGVISPEDKEMVTGINTAIAALNNLSAAQVNAECDTALSDVYLHSVADSDGRVVLRSTGLDQIAVTDPGGVSSMTTLAKMVVAIWRDIYKKKTVTSSEAKRYADNGTDVNTTETLSDDGTTLTKGAAT